MPELPEVQTVVTGLNQKIIGKKIQDVWNDYRGSDFYLGKDNIKNSKFFQKFKKEVAGAKIVQAKRRAKNILIYLDNKKVILIHLKMTGHLLYGGYIFDQKEKKFKPKEDYIEREDLKKNPDLIREIEKNPLRDPFNKFIHFTITFSDKKVLALSDMRKFATVTLLNNHKIQSYFSKTGPEPFDLKPSEFVKMAKKRKGKIKSVLMNPEFIAGIGNIYSDEILWKVGVHPESEISNISSFLLKEIIKFAKKILKNSIEIGGDSMSDFRNIEGKKGKFQNKHKCYKLENTPCQKKDCHGILEKKVVGARVARYCPAHQKKYI